MDHIFSTILLSRAASGLLLRKLISETPQAHRDAEPITWGQAAKAAGLDMPAAVSAYKELARKGYVDEDGAITITAV